MNADPYSVIPGITAPSTPWRRPRGGWAVGTPMTMAIISLAIRLLSTKRLTMIGPQSPRRHIKSPPRPRRKKAATPPEKVLCALQEIGCDDQARITNHLSLLYHAMDFVLRTAWSTSAARSTRLASRRPSTPPSFVVCLFHLSLFFQQETEITEEDKYPLD